MKNARRSTLNETTRGISMSQRWGIGGVVGLAVVLGGVVAGQAQVADRLAEQPPGAAITVTAGRISMTLQDAELKEVLKVFSQQSQMNIIASKDVEDQPITLYLDQVEPLDALAQIMRANGLHYEKIEGSDIYLVKSAAPEAIETQTRVYRLRFATISTSVLGEASAKLVRGLSPYEAVLARGMGTASSSGGGGQPQSGAFSAGVSGGSGPRGIDVVITKLLTEHGNLITDERLNALVVTDIPSNFPRIEQAIAQLDVPTPQVLIEVEVIETTINTSRDLGIEYGTGNEGTLFSFTPATKATLFPFQYKHAKYLAAAGPGLAALGLLDASQFTAVLKAIEKDTDTRILARPKVLTMDNESAVIRLAEDTAIGITATTDANTLQTTTEIERAQTGIILSVTPQINADGSITMLVEPTVNKPVTSTLTSQDQAVLNPKERSTRALVRVKDGMTLVVGGLIDRKEEEVIRKVPFLGDIPLVGKLFRKQDLDHSATELLVFITPHIMRDDGQVVKARELIAGQREQEPSSTRPLIVEEALDTQEQRQR